MAIWYNRRSIIVYNQTHVWASFSPFLESISSSITSYNTLFGSLGLKLCLVLGNQFLPMGLLARQKWNFEESLRTASEEELGHSG